MVVMKMMMMATEGHVASGGWYVFVPQRAPLASSVDFWDSVRLTSEAIDPIIVESPVRITTPKPARAPVKVRPC
jgi:hypothetical protein